MPVLEQQWLRRLIHAAVREEDGQIIPWVLFMMFFFLGMCALSIDVGHAMLIQRELQASTDAAALAAAQRLDYTDYATYALNYSAAAGKYNQYSEYSGTPTITPYCSPTVAGSGFNIPCTSTDPNAIRVVQTAVVPMFFTQYIGIPTMTVSAAAYASKGAIPQPYNVAIVLDTTPSMDYSDSSCHDESGNTIYVNGNYASQLQCASLGVQQLLSGLAPSVDYVSLFTFPAITTDSTSSETDCSASSKPYVTAYTFPSATATSLTNPSYTGSAIYNAGTTNRPSLVTKTGTYTSTYQVVSYSTDYRANDHSTSINTSSSLSNAVGVGSSSSCTGMQSGYNNTYYAAAIYAAQASLLAQQASRATASKNAIIILSDGNATAKVSTDSKGNPSSSTFSPGSNDMDTWSSQAATNSGSYPSWIGQCSQGITAAKAATDQGTTVFTIAYGSPNSASSSNCGSDYNQSKTVAYPNYSPCKAMQYMSSGWPGITSHFFSDATVNGSSSGCQASDANQSISSLNSIFKVILSQLSTARLIPPESI